MKMYSLLSIFSFSSLRYGFLVGIYCLLGQASQAQKATWLKEINQDIWMPFVQAYAQLDTKAYLSVHAKSLIRCAANEKNITDLPTYSENVHNFFQDVRTKKGKLAIKFRFLERISDGKVASERGIYELTYTNAQGKVDSFYGKFHVFHRKEKGKWKITIDYDSNEQNTIQQEQFLEGTQMEEVEKW